ncbi:hypothetical protein QFC20_004084 [Naganishia adeliensis]|uniref:Uncharacterized protein n=1 Tax=Naganishia adeliensis TaxID=92952 RepID=A0ACC2W438_9TREE|nr:hypothetical protein QFC20_004084 [Naganishia adeliensis]
MPRFLLAAGSNGASQLGIGHRDDVSSNVIDLASGANHSLLLLLSNGSSRRQVWITGTNEYHQLGPQFSTQTTLGVWTPLDVNVLLCGAGIPSSTAIIHEPIAIGCSWTTSSIVFSRIQDGERLSDVVISFGTNDFGELGCGTTTNDKGSSSKSVTIVRLPGWQGAVSASTDPKERMSVEHLAVGQRHMACVCRFSSSEGQDSSKQRVYGWGAARHGQLSAQSYIEDRTASGPSSAPPSSSSSPVPRMRNTSKSSRRPAKPPTLKAANSKYPSTQTTPVSIDMSEPPFSPASPVQITHVSCGASHTVLLLSDGRVLGLGSNAKGQLDFPREQREEENCAWRWGVRGTA